VAKPHGSIHKWFWVQIPQPTKTCPFSSLTISSSLKPWPLVVGLKPSSKPFSPHTKSSACVFGRRRWRFCSSKTALLWLWGVFMSFVLLCGSLSLSLSLGFLPWNSLPLL
jgi:hypothetical protein